MEPSVKDIRFDFDRADLRMEERQTLVSNAQRLKAHPDVYITIKGGADERGDIVYNLALSDKRAIATRDALLQLGVSPQQNRICHGLGQTVSDLQSVRRILLEPKPRGPLLSLVASLQFQNFAASNSVILREAKDLYILSALRFSQL